MALPQAGVELVASGLSGFVGDMHKANSAVSDFGDQGAKSGSMFDKGFGQVVTGALREVGVLAVEALAKAGQAVVGFVGDSVKKAGDFQAGMLEFQAVAGKDVDTKGLEKFHDLFISLGKELPVSTSEVQSAAIELIKGGIDPATIAAGGLRQNIQFAAAAMSGDLVGAAEVSAKILGGWADANATAQQKADFLTHATDQLTKAANASSVDVHELSLGIFNAQGIAKTAGVSFDDLTTTLALLSPRFASSSEAGNSLKNVIARLQPTTKPATEAMLALGLITEDGKNKFYDAQGSFIGFQQASQVLQDSLAGLSNQEKQATLQQIFGNDAMNAAASLAELGASGYQKMADSLATANGVSENAALKQQGFNTALENAKGSVEALQITLGEKLLPILTDLLNNVIAPAINAFTDWADSIFSAEDPLLAIIDQIRRFSPALSTIVAAIADFTTSGGDMGIVLDDINEGFGDTGNVLKLFYKVATDVFNGYMSIAQAVLPIVTKFWSDHGTEISAFLKMAYDKITTIIQTALKLYDAIVPPILKAIAGYISDHSEAIQSILSGAWHIISGVIGGALTLIEGLLTTALQIIQGDWSGAWETIKTMSANFVLDIVKVFTGLFEAIAGAFGTSLPKIIETWQTNWDLMVSIASKVIDRMEEIGGDIVDGIKQGINNAWGSFTSWLHDQIMKIPEPIRQALGISSPSKVMAEQVGEPLVLGIIQGIQNRTDELMAAVSDLGDQLQRQAESIGQTIANMVSGGFTAEANIDRQKLKNLKALDELSAKSRAAASYLLEDAQNIAAAMTDPKQAAAYFKLRSEQILELQKLTDQINKTQAAGDEARKKATEAQASGQDDLIQGLLEQADAADVQVQKLKEQYGLINAAQLAETKAFDTQAKANSDTTKLIEAIHNLLQGGFPVNDTGIGADLMNLLNMLQGSVQAGIPKVPQPTTNYNYYGQQGNNYTMPVQTNMTNEAISQSWAIMGAALP